MVKVGHLGQDRLDSSRQFSGFKVTPHFLTLQTLFMCGLMGKWGVNSNGYLC
jgi:hypothetical protein